MNHGYIWICSSCWLIKICCSILTGPLLWGIHWASKCFWGAAALVAFLPSPDALLVPWVLTQDLRGLLPSQVPSQIPSQLTSGSSRFASSFHALNLWRHISGWSTSNVTDLQMIIMKGLCDRVGLVTFFFIIHKLVRIMPQRPVQSKTVLLSTGVIRPASTTRKDGQVSGTHHFFLPGDSEHTWFHLRRNLCLR